MSNRREFIKNLALSTGAIPFMISPSFDISRKAYTSNDIDWYQIKSLFQTNEYNLVNLNNGSSGIMPIPVLSKYEEYLKKINSFAPYHVLEGWKSECQNNIQRLAEFIVAPVGCLAFVRNTTEAINLVLWGKKWQKNDEVITASWDYPFVHNTLQHLEEKFATKTNNITELIHNLSDEEIVSLYENKINDNTKLIIVTWMTHREGFILPVKKICQMAHQHGVEVLVDGAHTIGQFDISISDVECDYFACSLHKWLNAPLGSGVLFVKQEHIQNHSPAISYDPKLQDSIVKYDYLGTRPYHNLMTLSDSLDFMELTGIEAKSKRLRELNMRWISEFSSEESVTLYSNKDKLCAVASVGIKNVNGSKLKRICEEKFKLHVKSTSYDGLPMIRISPNINNDFDEMDRLSEAISYIVKNY